MPRIRIRRDVPDDQYQWPDQSAPSRAGWTPVDIGSVATDPPRGVPDVPLNVDHRYCTPPPLDPRYIEEAVGPKDDFPPYLGRPTRDFEDMLDEIAAAAQAAAPGTLENPYVVEDDDSAKQHRDTLSSHPSPGLENRGPRRSPRINRQQENASPSQPSASSSSSSRRAKGKGKSASVEEDEPQGRAGRFKKTAADGFTPKTSSPLKKVAYRAPSPHVPDPWYIPPRKRSTASVSVSVSSVYSSDSE